MADSFFGLDTSLSNLDDEGGGEPSEDEYDALNDETFGEAFDEFDWEMEHEHLAGQLESSRRHKSDIDDTANSQLEASLSQLVLDEIDAPQSRTLGSSVWRHDPQTFPAAHAPAPASTLKNVCTVEELERQLRAKQQQTFTNQNFFQPRFPPVILQRPPGLQAPVPLPFAPQQPMNHGLNNQTKLMGPSNQINQFGMIQNHVGQNMSPFMNKQFQNNTMNQSGQNNMMNQSGQTNMMNQSGQNNMMNQLPQNMSMHQMSQNNQLLSQAQMQNINMTQSMNHLGQNVTQMGQNMTHMGSNMPQMGQGANQMSQNINQMGQFVQTSTNQMGQLVHNSNQMGQLQNPNQMGQLQNSNQMAQNLNQLAPNMNQFGQGANQMGQNLNQLGQNVNQLSQTVNQMNQNTSQMGQNVRMNQNLNQMGQSSNQMGQNLNQIGQPSVKINQNLNHMGQATGQMVQNTNQMSQSTNQMGQNTNQMGKNTNQMGQNTKHLGHNANQMAQTTNQMGQTTNQMGQNMNHVGQASNQMGQSGQMMPNGNQFPHMMGQPRMMAPPPGINMPRQNFNQNMSQYNSTFRAQSKPEQQLNQPIMMTNQQPLPNAKLNSPNQMSQSPQNKSISAKLNKIDQKVTRSRVYNNSKMTSENLVQLIQNTHPMLQYNSYHNANHHPMLSNRSNVYAGNQFSHPVYQRHNGCFSGRHSANGDDASGSDSDEYAGLMTQREKQWLINIQMLQLNTGTPYIHDFYYTVFLERKASKEKEGVKEAHKANQQNHPFYSGGVKQESHTHRERHNSNRHNSTSEDGGTPRTYVPAQFENSLGKLQCGSVTAPRKIIDLEVVGSEPVPSRMSRASSVASTTHPQEVPREMKRTKQLLLDIEALYLILLRLEELNDPLAISNALILKEREEKQKQLEAAQKEAENEPDETNLFLKNIESVQRRPKQESPKSESIDKRQVVNLSVNQKPVPVKNLLDENKDDLVNKMFAGLLHSDRLPQMLTVRKGRTLVARFVSRVGPSHARLRAMWSRVFRALPAAARRDDGGLAALAPHYKKYIQNTNGWSAVLESCGILAEALDPARTPHALTTSFTLSCVCALIERAAILVNTPEATSNERQWSKFLKTLARALKHTSLNVARPVQPMQESKLMQHIKQLDSRSTIEILQRGKPAEFADITKMDVSEQLVKHLC